MEQTNKQMHALIQEMIHYRNSLEPGNGCDKEEIAKFEARYDQIVEKAKEEYEYIPATNNEAERLLRGYKRKQKQAVTFRSFESIDYLCQCMSMLVMMRQKEDVNLFDRVSQIFG